MILKSIRVIRSVRELFTRLCLQGGGGDASTASELTWIIVNMDRLTLSRIPSRRDPFSPLLIYLVSDCKYLPFNIFRAYCPDSASREKLLNFPCRFSIPVTILIRLGENEVPFSNSGLFSIILSINKTKEKLILRLIKKLRPHWK